MNRCLLAVVLAFSLSLAVQAEQDEISVIAQSFQQRLGDGEVTALQRTFEELRGAKAIDDGQWGAVAPVLAALTASVKDATPEGARASALRFVLLTNYLEVIRLKGECQAYGCVGELQLADTQYRQAFQPVATNGIPNADAERSAAQATRDAEAAYGRAQAALIHGKELDNVHELTIRIRALGELEPNSPGFNEAFDDLRQANDKYLASDDTAGSQLVTRALQRVFDPAVGTHFDNRHLIHLVQLRMVVDTLGQSAYLNETEKTGLRTQYGTLVQAANDAAYQAGAEKLQAQVMQLVRDRNLTQQDPWLAVRLSPSAVQRNAVARLSALRGAFGEVRNRFNSHQTFLQGVNRWRNDGMNQALTQVDQALAKAAERVKGTTSPDLIFNAYRDAGMVDVITRYFLEAVLNRSKTAYGYANFLSSHLQGMTGAHRFYDANANHEVFELLRQERREGVFNAYVNRETITLAAVSVALVAEAVSIPFTGGGSATAMPATLQAITSASIATSKVVLITSSALNIADRVKADGWHGLVNVDTAFDALVILSLSPRFTPGGAPAETLVGRWGQGTLTKIAQLQYSSATVLTGLGTVYGGYLVYNADKIAADLSKEGVTVTPAEVRRRGMINIALGVLAGTENYEYYRNGQAANGATFEEQIKPGTMRGTIDAMGRQLRPYGAAREAYLLHPGVFGMVKSIGIGLMYASEDFVLINEAILLSYSNLDTRYMNQVEERHPFPEMKAGESAVILVGFDEEDPLLYNGGHAQHSNHRELEKYGSNVYVYDFTSPDNMVEVLKKHAKEHGPVRYLKIVTHGRPGILYTRMVGAAPEEDGNESGWINAPWMQKHKAQLQKDAHQIFAADARIVLYACLVGSNVENKFTGEVEARGDTFLHELGDTFLVGGGAIDASTRILVGFDATIGSFAHAAFKNSFAGPDADRLDLKLGTNHYPTIPFFPLLMEGGSTATAMAPAEGQDSPRLIDSATYMAHRFATMVVKMPLLWYQYGVSLEGPWWASRYKYVEFPAH